MTHRELEELFQHEDDITDEIVEDLDELADEFPLILKDRRRIRREAEA